MAYNNEWILRIAEKIHYLVGKGIINVNEMRRHLREYLTNDLFCGQELPPTYNRRFWSRRTDLRNHIYRANVANRFSKCDQKNLTCFCVWGSNGTQIKFVKKCSSNFCVWEYLWLIAVLIAPRGWGPPLKRSPSPGISSLIKDPLSRNFQCFCQNTPGKSILR